MTQNKCPDNWLAALRIKAGLSQNELCAKSGIAISQISGYETRRTYPNRENLTALAAALGVDTVALFAAMLADVQGENEQKPRKNAKIKAKKAL